jgi:hypothetical protein
MCPCIKNDHSIHFINKNINKSNNQNNHNNDNHNNDNDYDEVFVSLVG